jgi:transcription-repair coupling factor (superfamily II helicase)
MDELLGLLTADRQHINLAGLQGSSNTIVAALLAEKANKPLLFITPSERLAELAVQDISLFTRLPVILYPGFDIPPYTPLSPDQTTVAERLNSLQTMAPLSLWRRVNPCSEESYRKTSSDLWQN